MLLAFLLSTLAQTDCVAVSVADEALGARVRDELLATVGKPLGDEGCATVVTLDAERRLTVRASAVTPPVVLEESLAPRPAATLATHVAEVVRGVLLEVEDRRERERTVAAPTIPLTPTPEPAPPAPTPKRFEARLGAGPLVVQGGLSMPVAIALEGGVRLGPMAVGVGGLASVLDASAAVAEGRLHARPFAAWAFVSVRVPQTAPLSLTTAILAGAFFVPLEGRASEPFVGARALGVTATVGLELRGSLSLSEVVGLWVAVAGHSLFQRLTLDVVGQEAAAVGPFIVRPAAGAELRW